MAVELDHVFICTAPGAPEAEELIRFGIVEGPSNRHPGQGTANRRFVFAGTFLELLWVENPVEAQSALVRRTGLWERWSQRDSGASPFGIGLRPADGDQIEIPPFATWDYRPPYLPEYLAIQMAENSHNAAVPLSFYLAFGRPRVSDSTAQAHGAGLRAVTRLRIGVPGLETLPAGERPSPSEYFHPADEHLLEMGFDGQKGGHSHDFRPLLPLVFHW